jgi:hypothetical protein
MRLRSELTKRLPDGTGTEIDACVFDTYTNHFNPVQIRGSDTDSFGKLKHIVTANEG